AQPRRGTLLHEPGARQLLAQPDVALAGAVRLSARANRAAAGLALGTACARRYQPMDQWRSSGAGAELATGRNGFERARRIGIEGTEEFASVCALPRAAAGRCARSRRRVDPRGAADTADHRRQPLLV